MKITPLFDNVVLERIVEEKKGQIILPVSNEKPDHAKVVAIGAGELKDDGTHTPMQVQVGNLVLFNKFAGFEFNVDNKNYILIKQQDILAIIN